MSLLIRQATAQDLPQVLQLYAQPAMDNSQVLSLQAAEQQFEQFSLYPNYRLFVACQKPNEQHNEQPMPGDAVVGTYALLVMHNLAHQGTPSAIVEDVVVSAALQSQGIGRAMMAHAMDLARAAGCYKLVLSSNQKRERAHAFYESLGFQRHGFSYRIEI
jgi:ribosomal protein S18 acetylase RimI-like enzyme